MSGSHVPGSKPGRRWRHPRRANGAPAVQAGYGILPPAAAVLSANPSRPLGIAFNQDRPTASDRHYPCDVTGEL